MKAMVSQRPVAPPSAGTPETAAAADRLTYNSGRGTSPSTTARRGTQRTGRPQASVLVPAATAVARVARGRHSRTRGTAGPLAALLGCLMDMNSHILPPLGPY